MSDFQTYDDRTKLWHWLSAGVIVAMYLIAQIIDFFPRPMRVWPISTHVALGLTLVVIYVARIQWRLTKGRKLPAADAGLIGLAGTAAHYGLYALIAAVLVLGVYLEAIRADNLFTLGRLPSIAPGNTDLRHSINEWHGLAANSLLILAGLHATAALYHRFVRHDGVLARMLGR